jgi:translation elongation factor EF-Ts
MLQQDAITETASTLNLVSFQIAELLRIKEELEARLSALLEHGDEGSKTYIHNEFKITVSTGYNYSLNKEEYEILASRLPACFDPVRKRVAYDLDKSIIRDAEKYASQDELALLAEFIEKKPKKLHVKIMAGI